MTIAFTWLWQGVAVALITALLLRAMPRMNAATRHVTWWASLLAVLGIPLVLGAGALRDRIPRLPLPGVEDGLGVALVLPAVPAWVGVVCASAWAVAALAGLIRVVRSCHRVQTLRNGSTAFDPAREARLRLWAGMRPRARRHAALRTSEDLAGACALGFRRPVILVGRQLADALDDDALDQIVMHEQAHLTRYDDWLRLIQAIVRSVAGLHPAVWWLSRRIDLDREAACDDHVVSRTGSARQYASALLDAAATAGSQSMAPAIVPGAIARASALRLRVSWLLDPRRARGTRATPIAVVAMTLPVLVVLASPQFAPLVAFVDAVEHALPMPGGSGLRSSAPVAAPSMTGEPSSGAFPVYTSAGRGNTEAAASAGTAGPASAADQMEMRSTRQDPAMQVEAAAPAPLESRVVVGNLYGPLAAAAPTGTMNGLGLPTTRGQASPWQALTTSSTDAARSTASAVASGAGRGGVAIGRAFTRAGRAIAAGH